MSIPIVKTGLLKFKTKTIANNNKTIVELPPKNLAFL
jgi:hypothetical protein